MNSRRRVVVLAAVLAVALSRSAASQQKGELSISGDVESPITLTVDELRKLPAHDMDDSRGAVKGSQDSSPRRYRGVLLRDVLNRAKLVERQPRGLRRSIVVATARDGYKAVFSWAELYISPIGDGVLVVYERDGVPLEAGEGPLALVSIKDTSPGPRHVKWLHALDVRMVAE